MHHPPSFTFLPLSFSLNDKGEIIQIDYSNHIRDTEINLPLEKIIPLFRAMKAFDEQLYHEDNCVTYKMKPGEYPGVNMQFYHGVI